MSPEDEKKLGKDFMRQVRQSLKLEDDVTSNEYIQTLGNKLASQIDTRGQSFTFFIVADSTINAFAGPAGYIGVHTGLIQAAETEGELASVLAHEIAHVVQQHLLRSIESSQNMSLATVGAIIAAILLGGEAGGQVSEAVIASTVAGSVQKQLSFSRTHEQEADRVGIEMLYRAGYDPNNMADFFEILQQRSRFTQHDIPEFLLTHPVTTSRIADTRGRAAAYKDLVSSSDGVKKVMAGRATQFELVKARLKVLTENLGNQAEQITNLENTIKKSEITNHVQVYELALRYQQQGQYDKAKHLLGKLLHQEPQRIAYIIAAVENEISAKKYATAINLIENPVLVYPNNYALTTLYAKALIFNNQPKKAMDALQNLIRSGRYTPDTYKLFATAAKNTGKDSDAYEAMGNYYYELGEINTAISHFEEALTKADNDNFRELRLKARISQLKGELLKMRTEQQKP